MRPSGTVRILASLAVMALVFTTGCDDQFGPTQWVAIPDTVDIFSLNRTEYLRLPSGYDVLYGNNGQRTTIEDPGASGNWDFALAEQAGVLSLLPAGAIAELRDSNSGIARLPGENFDSIERVPRDNSVYQDTAAVPLEAGMVYAIRSRRFHAYGGQVCNLYGKLTPVSIDEEAGILRFAIVRNPDCNDTSMVPPDSK